MVSASRHRTTASTRVPRASSRGASVCLSAPTFRFPACRIVIHARTQTSTTASVATTAAVFSRTSSCAAIHGQIVGAMMSSMISRCARYDSRECRPNVDSSPPSARSMADPARRNTRNMAANHSVPMTRRRREGRLLLQRAEPLPLGEEPALDRPQRVDGLASCIPEGDQKVVVPEDQELRDERGQHECGDQAMPSARRVGRGMRRTRARNCGQRHPTAIPTTNRNVQLRRIRSASLRPGRNWAAVHDVAGTAMGIHSAGAAQPTARAATRGRARRTARGSPGGTPPAVRNNRASPIVPRSTGRPAREADISRMPVRATAAR